MGSPGGPPGGSLVTPLVDPLVAPKKGQKIAISVFLKKGFLTTWPLGGSTKLYHMKFKSKISYLGEKISILPWQMAEHLYVKVRP